MTGCALTGHRALNTDFSAERAEEDLIYLICKGVDTFYCGMAMGFDLTCANILLRLKETCNIRLIACIPCANQAGRFSFEWKRKYRAVLKGADEVIQLKQEYDRSCMFERNRYMVDHAQIVYAYCTHARGGTAYTVNYAKKCGKPIFYYGQDEQLSLFD